MAVNGSFIYVVQDTMGGIASLNANLINYGPKPTALPCAIRLLDRHEISTRIKGELGAGIEMVFKYSSRENIYAVLKRLSRFIPSDEGAVVSNNALELALYSVHPTRRTIFQIVHDEFNFRLSQAYEPIVDVMIAHSRYYYEKLLREFPNRSRSIFYLPYGIHLSPNVRSAGPGPLRLVFLGRLCESKGVYDLPIIDQLLQKAGVEVKWTIIGDGPERISLQAKWLSTERIVYASPASNEEVLALCAQGDAFVLPTRFEGFPVALLEAMSAGLVPVITDLPSGVPEVVIEGVGFKPPMRDCEAFAAAIADLSRDRNKLEAMSAAARKQAERFDVRNRVTAYHELFARWREFKRPWPGPLRIKHGSRLDRPWLPNVLTRTVRALAA